MRVGQFIRENFTWTRWRTDAFQMYFTAFLMLVSTAQLGLGAAPQSSQYHLEDATQNAVAFCCLWGVLIVMLGLHLKDVETGLWIEMSGYLCIFFVLSLSVYLQFTTQTLAFTTHSFAFDQAFVYAALQRSIQVWLYKRTRRRAMRVENRVEALKEVLRSSGLDPNRPVVLGDDEDG